jgi:hypothetical protein
MSNEPDRIWNNEMYALIQETIHYRKGIPPDTQPDMDKISEFEERYNVTLKKAEEEYEYIPPTTNNEAERLLRKYKRKQQQAVTFRSQESIEYLCQCMSMLIMMRQKEEMNIFDRVSKIYG